MSTIPSPLPATPASSTTAFAATAKPSGHARAARGAHPAAPAPALDADSANANAPADSTASGLESALARIQGQNQASALTSLRDLEEAMAATRSAQQIIQTQSSAARAAHTGITSAAALRVLEN